MSDQIEKLPCPWCKNERLMHLRDEVGNLHWVFCNECRAEGPVAMGWEEAQVKWNARNFYGWRDIEEHKPEAGQVCIVAAGVNRHGQHIGTVWSGTEFEWVDSVDGFGIDPLPSEMVTHWMPWPEDPE